MPRREGQDGNVDLSVLIQRAREVRMTAEQKAEQRRSFAYGNAAFENPLITREMIREEERRLVEESER